MEDRELLELAAKAAGIEHHGYCTDGFLFVGDGESGAYDRWNPLANDGDALRLAVALQLTIRPQEKCVFVESNPETLLGFSSVSELEMCAEDPYAATRRAIVRAAAEIGGALK